MKMNMKEKGKRKSEKVWGSLLFTLSLLLFTFAVSAATLPSGYVELEYIESTGTQYIDTGYVPVQAIKIECEVDATTKPFGDQISAVFGSYKVYNDTTSIFFSIFQRGVQCPQYLFAGGSKTGSEGDFPYKQRVQIVCDSTKAEWWPSASPSSIQSFSPQSSGTLNCPYPLYIFALCAKGDAVNTTVMKLYSFKISENGVLKRDFVPCANPSGEIGLYDIITEEFYDNKGSGLFKAGRRVSSAGVEITKAWQKNPGSGIVDFTYTVGYTGAQPCDLKIKVGAEGCDKTETVLIESVPQGTVTTNVNVKALLGKAYPFVMLSATLDDWATVPTDASGFDYSTDGVTFVPGDYCIVDLTTGQVTNMKNVKDGTVFNTDEYKTTKMVFRYIPEGKFKANCSTEMDYSKLTANDVELSAYWIGVFEVTEAQYNMVMSGSVSSGTNKAKTGIAWNNFRGGDWSNWDGSYANVPAPGEGSFVCAFNEKVAAAGSTAKFDIPSSFQWERAMRAGTRTDFFFSDTTATAAGATDFKPLYDYAWFVKNSGKVIHPVGEKKPNAWGLYDVYGNVWKWCLDGYVSLADVTVQKDYVGANSEEMRTIRAGDHSSDASGCTSVRRHGQGATKANDYIGYRLVRRAK